jgi:acyl-CoA synthetase
VTVLAAVSTQFVMLLNEPAFATTDLTSLRALFTGGEMVPYARALEFEQRTRAAVLQFYGSNETGAFSKTALDDPQELRLTTAGRLIAGMDVRLFDDGRVTSGDRGQPGGKGPLLSRGYYNDPAANEKLFTPDGYMLMEDIVTIDSQGYLRVAGRKGDFIIRGGKNISCAAVEEAARGHPAVALAAAVGVPDEVFGERTMLFIATRDGADLSLAELTAYLEQQQVSREMFPEYLQVLPELPRSSGDKIAKQVLREQGRAHVAALATSRR